MEYYDSFDRIHVRDYVQGNPRLTRQHEFFRRSVPRHARRVLVVGCGNGGSAYFIAAYVARNAEVLAIDLSPRAIQLANGLYPHPRITFRRQDFISEDVDGQWDAIILPDVYEHIPLADRDSFHARLATTLSASGRVLLTVPTPGHQAMLRELGRGLQIVDEDVSFEDTLSLSRAVGGTVTYYSVESIFNTNDYLHVLVEREGSLVRPFEVRERAFAKKGSRPSCWGTVRRQFLRLTGLTRLVRCFRRRKIEAVLAQTPSARMSHESTDGEIPQAPRSEDRRE